MDNNVKEKIEYEISRIEKLINDAKPLLDLCKLKEPDFVEITASAQILHSFYNGVESVVVLFLKSIDEKIPNDSRWHKTLFEIIFDTNSKNREIIRRGIKEQMEQYMYFRHFIRHSYSSELKWSEMEPLVKNLEEIWKIIKSDFELFIKNN
ncbi:MAG: hypothetical protein LBQ50_06015 [Planctomycetaceae bacterium]|nr:hypothetical protein [Planctomycetaceae bacterium]